MTASGWIEATLDEIATSDEHGFVDGPFGSNLPASLYVKSGIPVIRGSNLSLGLTRFDSSEFVYVSEETADRLCRSCCKANDIVFTKKGTIGQTGYVPSGTKYARYLISSNQMKLTVDQSKAHPLYVYYHVSSERSQRKIRRDSEATGVPKTNLTYLRKFPILLPPLSVQGTIAGILGVLDDKIELNRRMSATLEGMARAIFKSWFVDFDPVRARMDGRQPHGMDEATAALFPSEFEETEIGKTPKGWKIGPLNESIEILSGGTPKTSVDEYWDGDSPWYTVRDAPSETDVFVTDTEKKVTQAGIDNSSTKLLPVYTTIISARGTVGKLALTAVEMTMNQSCYGIRGAENRGNFYTYYLMKTAVSELQANVHGTVFDTITRSTFNSLETCHPPTKLTIEFDRKVAAMFGRIQVNLRESQTLAALRDTLLPKLLSGEVRVPEAEAMVGRVV